MKPKKVELVSHALIRLIQSERNPRVKAKRIDQLLRIAETDLGDRASGSQQSMSISGPQIKAWLKDIMEGEKR